MLSTLDLNGCSAFEYLPNSIGRNKRLRVLRIVGTGIRGLPSSISALENLEYLRIKGCYELVGLPEGIGNLTKLKELDLDGSTRIPTGIGQLTELEKLNMFCVETDKKYAQISELATLSRINGKLSIYSLGNLTDQSEACQACLKQKEKLHELELSWGSVHDSKNPEHDVVALDGLEPPLGIKQIKIFMYSGGRFASWMLKQVSTGVQGHGQFPFLTRMSLENFPNLKHLDGLVQLPCLEELHLKDMCALESISDGGPFPSLAKVKLEKLHSLGEVWVVTDRTLFGKEGEGCSNNNPHQSGQLQIGSRLTDLLIDDCPKLVIKPHLPISLEQLWLRSCNSNLVLSSFHAQMTIKSCDGLPQSTGHLTTLQELEIRQCNALVQFPESLGELRSLRRLAIYHLPDTCLPKSLCHLTSLKELSIAGCEALVQLPEGLGELCSLSKLNIWGLPGLTCLPQSLCCFTTSLRELDIKCCPGLKSLPEWIKGLTALQRLDILGCHDLERRCEGENREDWHLISHITNLHIGKPWDVRRGYHRH